MINQWQEALRQVSRQEKVAVLSSFFKTGRGQYGEGDVFIGVTVPDNRRISRTYHHLPLEAIDGMLRSEIHEFRLGAMLALVEKYRRATDQSMRRAIVDFYLDHADYANNWDLVDLSAPKILGEYLVANPSPTLLTELVESGHLWRQRIAVVSTYTLIHHDDLSATFDLSTRLLTHPHDLIHKATGWMLREAGKRNTAALTDYLDRHAAEMPRTMLRYAIERLDPATRRRYMSIPRKK